MSIFARLGFDSTAAGDSVQPLSDGAQKQINSLPPLLSDWQVADMSSSNVGGYYQNPIITNLNLVWGTCNTIVGITDAASTNAASILTAATSVRSASAQFKRHTDRISGVEPVESTTTALPHLDSAMGIGKMVMYIVGQTEGVMNNAPLMGSFTSLQANPTLMTYYSTISNYPNQIITSLNYATVDDGLGNITTSITSNLTPTQISTMTSSLNDIASYMNTRRNGDVSFFTNSKAVVDDYNTVKQFSDMGQSQKQLVQSVGTPKLLSRLNS
jgi:hypothetical protein